MELSFLNMGDTYGHGSANGGVFEKGRQYGGNPDHSAGEQRWAESHQYDSKTNTGLRPGNLLVMPWRLALLYRQMVGYCVATFLG